MSAERSDKQIQASKINGSKSKGPHDRSVVRFNALKHGLRASEVVLPGEDPAEFEAMAADFFADWAPKSRTRAVLVERLVITAWMLQRATRAQTAARRISADGAALYFDNERRRRIDRAIENLAREPLTSMYDLESHADGLDRLIPAWESLVEALAKGPSGWSDPMYHHRLMFLHAREADDPPAMLGEPGRASARLRDDDAREIPRPAAESEADVALLEELAATKLERLRGLRAKVRDPEEGRAEAILAALNDTVPSTLLRVRYEMGLERSFRSTLNKLMELKKSGADLNEAVEAERPAPGSTSEVSYRNRDTSNDAGSDAQSSGSFGASNSAPPRSASDGPNPATEPPTRVDPGPERGG